MSNQSEGHRKLNEQAFQAEKQSHMSLVRLVEWGANQFDEAELFYGHGTDNAWDEAAFIAFHVLDILPEEDISPDLPIEAKELSQIIELYRQRILERKPAAYLLGEAWFGGRTYRVNENVLIPRSPFAELIDRHFSPWLDGSDIQQILEIGTGSGCIAIATALALPKVTVDATDISSEAFELASINVQRHGVASSVNLIQSDLFKQLPAKKYDLIISNPPYVPVQNVDALPAEYHHEPRLGLEAGETGLDIVIPMIEQAKDYLNDGGLLIVEVGESSEALISHFPQLPFVWLEFEFGGEGVFLLTKGQLP